MTQLALQSHPRWTRIRRAIAAVVLTCGCAAVQAAPDLYRGISVEVIGEGAPVLMIPGLNSGADTWRETCLGLQAPSTGAVAPGPAVQCHLVQLPGFAGLAGVGEDAFLASMRDRLLAYVAERNLQSPDVVGHSLGGTMALQMAIKQPQVLGRLVIVDALPYYPAAQNPTATVEQTRPMAEQMRAGMLAADDAAYAAQAQASVRGMVHAPERVETLKQWSRSSERATTAQAMYELMTIDLRGELGAITSPTLVLGSWAAYQPFGATQDSTRAIFAAQFAQLPGVRIEMSESGYHFLMWDDPQWLQAQLRAFLASAP